MTAIAEAPVTLDQAPPKVLGFLDQTALWGNLGVSLLGFTGAIYVLNPSGDGVTNLSLAAGITAIVVGTLLGTLAVAVSGLPGTMTGSPAMVLLRGLFGARVSYVPTVLNILQCVGWAVFELITISTAAHTVAPSLPHWLYVLMGGVVTTALTIRPLGWIRTMRRYVTIAVVVVLAYLTVELLRHPLPSFGHGTWNGFWIAMDTTVAAAVSFVPLASDYTRHSRSNGATFGGALIGYGVAQAVCYMIGLFALLTVARTPDDIYGAFIAVPVGAVAFAILAIRELDQSFANVYSTAMSVQNLRPRWDRRVLAVVIGVIATVGALWLNIASFENFLLLLGSVFVPMFGVLAIDFFVVAHRQWDLSEHSPARWAMLVPWFLGFVAYQLINPGYIGWWSRMWAHIAGWIHFTPASWMSASICSLVIAVGATLVVGALQTIRVTRPAYTSPA